jgi:hypothetical protein
MTNMELDNIKLLRANLVADFAGYSPGIDGITLGLYADDRNCRWSLSGWLHFSAIPEHISGYGASIDDAKRELAKNYRRKLIELTYRQRMEQEMAVLEE